MTTFKRAILALFFCFILSRADARQGRHANVAQNITLSTQSTNSGGGGGGAGNVTIDTVASGGANVTTSLTFSHTTAGANRVLIVGCAWRTGSSQEVTGVTYNSIAMTKSTESSNQPSMKVAMWQLINPTIGANNVVVTLDNAANFACGSISVNGANQTSIARSSVTNEDTTTVATTLSSTLPTTQTTDFAIDAIVVQTDVAASLTASGGQTQRLGLVANTEITLGMSTKTGASGTTAMGWTWTGGNRVKMCAVDLQP